VSLQFSIESLAQSWHEMLDLAKAHWMETEEYRHGQPFLPSLERYDAYARAGWLIMFIARSDGKMVGYSIMYLVPSMHTQQMIATEDTWYLAPEVRKGRNAIRFYKYVEAECMARGAVEMIMTAKLANGAGKILEYLDFAVVSKQYSKKLVRADSPIHQPVVGEPSNVRPLATARP